MKPLEDKSTENLVQLWFQSGQWFEASLKHHIDMAGPVSCMHLLNLHLEVKKACIFPALMSKRQGYFQNINSLYSPYFDLQKFITDAVASEAEQPLQDIVSSFHYCLLKPVVRADFCALPLTKSIRYSFFEYSSNWRAFASSSIDYWNNRPSILLNTIRRRQAKCSRQGCKFRFFTNITDNALQDYWHVYDRSWKPSEVSRDFINWLFRFCTYHGLLRLGIAYLDSKPIAVQFWIVQYQTAYIFKLAQDIQYNDLSPGTVLMAKMIDWVYQNDNIECIDFLTGSDEYKKLWMDECRPLVGVEIFNMNSIRGIALWYYQCLKRITKKLLNRSFKNEK